VVPPWILKTLSELRDLTKQDNCHIESIFSVIPPHIESDIRNLEQEHLDQQIAALNNALKHREEWNTNPKQIWKLIHEKSIYWCKQFQIPLKPFTGFHGFPRMLNFR
jgi:hypothetical protein